MGLQVELLETTLTRAKNENGGIRKLGLRFYERLFEKYPQVRSLFTTPPEQQHVKLMASIGATLAAIKEPEHLLPYLHAMGIRHLNYDTQSDHYPAVKENLIAVLKEHLSVSGQWTDAMESAWSEALDAVSGIMIEAAENPFKYAGELADAGFMPNGFRKDTEKPWELQPVSVSGRI